MAEVVTLAALVRIYRKHLIVRYLFIRFSDWTAHKIDSMAESASWEIMTLQKHVCEERGCSITDDEARKAIPYVILEAKKEWRAQADYFQAMLRHNGMSPLGVSDLDRLVLDPGLAGLKSLPMPKGS